MTKKMTDIEKRILEGSKSRYGYGAGPREHKAVDRLIERLAPIHVWREGNIITVKYLTGGRNESTD